MLLRIAGRTVASDGDGMTVLIGVQMPKVSRNADSVTVVGARFAVNIPRASAANLEISATVERQFHSYLAAAKFQYSHLQEALNFPSGDLEIIDILGVAYCFKNAVFTNAEYDQTGLHLKSTCNFTTGGVR